MTTSPLSYGPFISRAQAKEQGLTYYFTGKPCKHGHNAYRLVKGAACSVCNKERAAKHRKDNAEHYKKQKQDYYQKNKQHIDERHRQYMQRYMQNPESRQKYLQAQAAYNNANKEKNREYHRAYREK